MLGGVIRLFLSFLAILALSMKTQQEMYDELSYYTLAHVDPSFIHQHIVDAFAAQTADTQTKSIKITFALIGLYLYLEKHFTGKQVQLIHMQLGRKKQTWPTFELPKERGSITVSDVLNTSPGEQRDTMIKKWCESVWQAYTNSHQKVATIISTYLPEV